MGMLFLFIISVYVNAIDSEIIILLNVSLPLPLFLMSDSITYHKLNGLHYIKCE